MLGLCQETKKSNQEVLSNIQPEFIQKLTDGCQKHLVKVKLAKGHISVLYI